MCEIGDRLHLSETLPARLRRNKPHGPGDGRNIGVAFAFKAAENSRESDPKLVQSVEQLVSVVACARRHPWGEQLDRRNAQIARSRQLKAPARIQTGEDADRPFLHENSPSSGSASMQMVARSACDHRTHANFVMPGLAIAGSGAGPHSYCAGRRSSSLARA